MVTSNVPGFDIVTKSFEGGVGSLPLNTAQSKVTSLSGERTAVAIRSTVPEQAMV